MLKIGDKVLERGGVDVHIIKAVREKDKIYDCVRMRDDRERRISFQNAVKTKRNPQMLVRCYGTEYISNVERAMRKAKIKYTVGTEDGGRHDVAKFFVEEKDLPQARVCLDDYYKNGEDQNHLEGTTTDNAEMWFEDDDGEVMEEVRAVPIVQRARVVAE